MTVSKVSHYNTVFAPPTATMKTNFNNQTVITDFLARSWEYKSVFIPLSDFLKT